MVLNNKKDNGITLISLVVTIIILLILAGITIAQLTKNGLFEKAEQAKKDTMEAQEKENLALASYEEKIDEVVGNKNISGNSSYRINKIGEQTGTSPINVDLSLYDSLYIKVIESLYQENFTCYIPTYDLNTGGYTIAGGGTNPGRFVRITIDSDSSPSTIALNIVQVNASNIVTDTSKIIIYGINY